MTTTSETRAPIGPGRSALWRTAQWLGIALTAILIVGLIGEQDITLNLFWNVLVPLVPASLLISPAIWRNVCPLATVNMLSNRRTALRTLPVKLIPAAGMLGIALLVILVPARRFLFNSNGIALAVTFVLVAISALVLGAFFDMKAGFCNAICPVLPVERLYGQRPFLNVGNPRCAACTLCTHRGCIDLAPTKSVAHTLGAAGRSHAWLTTSYGAFAAAFPGFVVGYYTTNDMPLTGAGGVYVHVAVWAGASFLLTVLVVRALNVRAALATLALGALAAGFYYWFAAPVVASALGAAAGGTVALRSVALGLVAVWLLRAVAHAPKPTRWRLS